MPSDQQLRSDNGLISRLDRALARVETVLLACSGAAVFLLMVLAVLSVSGRMANAPLPGYVDYVEQAMPYIAFCGIAYALRHGVHVRMELGVQQLRGRSGYAVEAAMALLVLVLMALLTWGSWSHFVRSFDFSLPLWSADSSFDIGLPVWPAKLAVPIAFFVLCLRALLQLCAYLQALIMNLPEPLAVPLPGSAIEEARAESAHIS